MDNFAMDSLKAVKFHLNGLPSFCRLVMYELLDYCDIKTGIISIGTLEDLAAKDFWVSSSPGRKKESINGDTLRNAFRTIKKAKPHQFKFHTKQQRIIIELPFLRELFEHHQQKSREVAAEVSSLYACHTNHASVDNLGAEDGYLGSQVTSEVAAATSFINNINNKQTNTKQLASFQSKHPISDEFMPNPETIREALARGYANVTDPNEIQAFIDYNKAQNTRWQDYNQVFLIWLARVAEHRTNKLSITDSTATRKTGDEHAKQSRNNGKTAENVKHILSHQFEFCEKTRRFYQRETNPRRHRHIMVAANGHL